MINNQNKLWKKIRFLSKRIKCKAFTKIVVELRMKFYKLYKFRLWGLFGWRDGKVGE